MRKNVFKEKSTIQGLVKFIYSEKATKVYENSTLLLTGTTKTGRNKWRFRKILWPTQNNMNFTCFDLENLAYWFRFLDN